MISDFNYTMDGIDLLWDDRVTKSSSGETESLGFPTLPALGLALVAFASAILRLQKFLWADRTFNVGMKTSPIH